MGLKAQGCPQVDTNWQMKISSDEGDCYNSKTDVIPLATRFAVIHLVNKSWIVQATTAVPKT